MDVEPVTEAQVRDARHAYYGAIAYIDDLLGRLMAALRSAGLAEETIVVLTSDHGEMLGERGLWYKMSFFEGASRVPLVIASPGRFAPRRVGASVSLVDLMPTLFDISGGNAQSLGIAIDGRSLAPHLRGGVGHDEAIGEYLAEGAISPVVMIRRGEFKFIHSPADPDQLYDLGVTRASGTISPSTPRRRRLSPPSAPKSPSVGTLLRWTPKCARVSGGAGLSTPRSARARTAPGISSLSATRRSNICATAWISTISRRRRDSRRRPAAELERRNRAGAANSRC